MTELNTGARATLPQTLATLLIAFFLTACGSEDETTAPVADFESWYPDYNKYVANWVDDEIKSAKKKIVEIESELAEATDDTAKKTITTRLEDQKVILTRQEGRRARGDYFQFHDAADLPEGLVWEDGQEQPEIGDPASKKGGTFRYWLPSFPATIRPFGPNSNTSFRGELYDNIEVALISLHPETGAVIPGCASEWAISEDKKTCFFRLDPDAKYNDGVPVEAVDFMWFIYLRASDNVVSPWFKQYLREQLSGVALYGDGIVAFSLPEAKPKLPYFCSFRPSPPHFFAEYGPDFKERYQWRVPPTTAAYTILEGDLVKGVSVTLSRAEDWWAKDKKFYRYRFNADRLRYTVVRDPNKAWELFRAGQLDYFRLDSAEHWYDKSEMDPVYDGHIERFTWYNQYPRIPWSLYLNTAKEPLGDRDVRIGIAYACNWQKIVDIVFRGDAARLPGWTKGYGPIDNPEISARPYSVDQARESFVAAGYTEEGDDGILRKADGTKLEVVISYGKTPTRDKMMTILQEDAIKAGLSFVLDPQDPTAVFNSVLAKEHEISHMGWGFQPPYPRYYEYFHSTFAFDEEGNMKQNTNNIFSFANERMDELASAYRNATSEDILIETAHEMQQIIHDEGIYIPGFMQEYVRGACSRWVRWPNCENTEFCPPQTYVPYESYVYWIDEEMREETLEAKRTGGAFPEVDAIYERYRTR